MLLGFYLTLRVVQVIWSPWAGAAIIADPNMEVAAIITSEITQLFEGAGLKVIYFGEKV